MANTLHPKISEEFEGDIQKVVEELALDGFQIWTTAPHQMHFKKNFHTATVTTEMVRQNRWPDIRHIFRASLEEGPQLTNEGAEDNEWKRSWR